MNMLRNWPFEPRDEVTPDGEDFPRDGSKGGSF